MATAYIVERSDYEGAAQYAAFTTRAAAEDFVARGPESERAELDIVEMPLDPPAQGCFYRVVNLEDRKLEGGGWTYNGVPDTNEEFVSPHKWFVYGGTQDSADARAQDFIDASPPVEYPFFAKASDFDARVGCAWIVDQSGRVWTHPNADVMENSVRGTRLYGPSPFDYLARCAPDQRSGWVLLAQSLDDMNVAGAAP